MKKKIDMTLISGSLICLLPVLLSLVFYSRLPERVPIHWDSAGNVDGYGSKVFFTFGLPMVFLVLNAVTYFFQNNDPKRANMPPVLRTVTQWLIPVTSLVLQALTIWNALGGPVDFHKYGPAAIGLLIVLLGNYLPKCKQNYTLGIRLPWTLSSENNWFRTHRFAGYLWVVGGLVMIAGAFFTFSWIFIADIAALVILPTAYSYLLYKKNKTREKTEI